MSDATHQRLTAAWAELADLPAPRPLTPAGRRVWDDLHERVNAAAWAEDLPALDVLCHEVVAFWQGGAVRDELRAAFPGLRWKRVEGDPPIVCSGDFLVDVGIAAAGRFIARCPGVSRARVEVEATTPTAAVHALFAEVAALHARCQAAKGPA